MHRLLILLDMSHLLTLIRLGNLQLLLYWDQHLRTIWLLNDLVLDLLGLLLLLLLLYNNRLLKDGMLIGHLCLLRKRLKYLLLVAIHAFCILLPNRLLHQRVDVSFRLSFDSQGCIVNETSSFCRRRTLHFLIYSILECSDTI